MTDVLVQKRTDTDARQPLTAQANSRRTDARRTPDAHGAGKLQTYRHRRTPAAHGAGKLQTYRRQAHASPSRRRQTPDAQTPGE